MKSIIFFYLILLTNGFQPIYFKLSQIGNEFEAANSTELLIIFDNIRSVIRCAILCSYNIQCRTFNFHSNSHQCYLFEGSIDTGHIISTSSSIIVGWINVKQDSSLTFTSIISTSTSSSTTTTIETTTPTTTIVTSVQTTDLTSIETSIITTIPLTTIVTSVQTTITTTGLTSIETSIPITTTFMTTVVTSIPITTTPQTTITTSTATTSMFCPPQLVTNGILFSITNPSSSNYPLYDCYNYQWIATDSSSTLSFFFRQDPGGWMLDDISVYYNSTQLIINGGFETGDLTGWTWSGTCNINVGQAYYGSSYAHNGNYYYYDRCAGDNHGDTLQQTFPTIIGQTYFISFWLTNYDCCSTQEIANITIY
ncbi:unnamed protein product [Adineta steineri]|uniref:Apple domain-containing protein n=1 Tax=Adineta steineri TaxID=433720 RepID=A0A815YMU9_9BILA|nr:unnamed protein product [Adineta steineri]CAF1572970.1 unnamed protein product [Adineta steineri]